MTKRRICSLVLALPLAGCGKPATPVPSLLRLTGDLGTPRLLALGRQSYRTQSTGGRRELRIETRPAVTLTLGQVISTDIQARPGVRLDFAFALLPEAPATAPVQLVVEANRTVLFNGRVFPHQRDRWQHASVAVPQVGRLTISFRAEPLGVSRPPTAAVPAPGQPWIALSVPRLCGPPKPAGRRVLIWISQDTVRADHVTAYGYTRPTTARFERLAGEFTFFENGVAPASWTLPSLASQFTSRYPSFHGAVTEAQALGPQYATVFEQLAGQGFTVLGVTGNVFVTDDFGMARGFDALWYTNGRADEVTQLARAALQEWGGGDLALFVHYQDPHHPYTPPAPFDTLFDRSAIGHVNSRDPAQVEHTRACYDGEIAFTDYSIRSLLRELKAVGAFDPAVIVYSADHGEEFLDHGAWAHARTVYEELVRVPFGLRVPGVPARRVTEPVSLVDLAPTILEALGVPAPPTFQGVSLLPTLRSRSRVGSPVFTETQRNAQKRHVVSLREGRYKYILETRPGLGPNPEILHDELYDLESDPRERSPLERGETLERMRRTALAYLERARREKAAAAPARLTPEAEERLRVLGYIQ